MDIVRGMKLGCLGSVCFSVAPLLLALIVGVAMGLSTKDAAGSRALGVGVLLFFVGNGSVAAWATLAALAAAGAPPARGTVAGIGGIAGALFTAVLVTSRGIGEAWLLPVSSALIVVAVWVAWRLARSRHEEKLHE